MLKRQEQILAYLEAKGDISYRELCALLPDVSEMTLRRDLVQLESERKLIRVRGGARKPAAFDTATEAAYQQRMQDCDVEKRAIGRQALHFLEQARSVYLDSGTTCYYFAQEVPSKDLYIITPAPMTALELARHEGINVHLTGGRLNPETLTLSGVATVADVKRLNIDTAFMATSAFSLRDGFSCGDFYEAELKRTIIRKAQRVVMMMDLSKLDRTMPYTFAKLAQIDYLVTAGALPETYAAALERAKVNVIGAAAGNGHEPAAATRHE